jgi:cytochrome b pre-mRNA-processing protein 3
LQNWRAAPIWIGRFADFSSLVNAVAVNWFSRRNPVREAAARAYQSVVAQARQRAFFAYCGVPDTLDGRFELICLHAFLYLRRLKAERPAATALSQAFFDAMFTDMDRALREIGVGDLSVGRQVKRMAQAFYGRIRAYESGLAAGDGDLAAALTRNLYGTVAGPPPAAGAMALYARRAAAALDRQDRAALLAGHVGFGPPPEPAEARA